MSRNTVATVDSTAYDDDDDDNDDLGLSVMMTHTVTSSTSRPSRGREGGGRRNRSCSRTRSRSSSILRRMGKKEGSKKDCAPSTPLRGRKRDVLTDDNKDDNNNKRDASRPRSKSVLRRMMSSRKKNSAATTSKTTSKTTTETSSVAISPATTATDTATDTDTTNNNSSKSNGERKKPSSKKKPKKIKQSSKTNTASGGNEDNDDDNNKDEENDEISSQRSNCDDSVNSKLLKNSNSKKNKSFRHRKATSSRVKAIREPILCSEGTVIKYEMENLFPSPSGKRSERKKAMTENATPTPIPSPKRSGRKKATTENATPTPTPPPKRSGRKKATTENRTTSTGKLDNIDSGNGNGNGNDNIAVISFESDKLTMTDDDCDQTTEKDSSCKSGISIHRPHSQKSNGSGNGSGSGSVGSSYGIMSNKAAEEQAEAALNRVAAHQQMERSTHSNSGSSFWSAMDAESAVASRRMSNSSSISRRNEQYQRLNRDSGLTSIGDFDDDASYRSFNSRRSHGNFTAMSALHKQLDEHKEETGNLQKQLSEALAKVAQLDNNLRREEERSTTAKVDLSRLKSKLVKVQDEKSFLIESVRDMEDEFDAKDERVKKLQQVVETQLDTVEFLEDRIDKTEEEFFQMEDELNALILVVENKNITDEGVDELVTNESTHISDKEERLARMGSIREGMVSRKGSIKMQKEESRRLLFNDSITTESPQIQPSSVDRSRLMNLVASSSGSQEDLEERDHQLKTRELKLEADQEECDNREERLDIWERQLLEMDDQLKNESINNCGVLGKEKSKSTDTSCNLESGGLESNRNQEPSDVDREKEYETLKTLIASLEKEKEYLHGVQIDDSSKLKKLRIENKDLRGKLDHVTKIMTESELPSSNKHELDADQEAVLYRIQEETITALPTKESELSGALALIVEKNKAITILEGKLEKIDEKSQNGEDGEEGQDLLIRELQNQLVTAKKEVNQHSSGSYVTKLKVEIHTLKENIRDLKKKLKREESFSKSHLKKKDDSIKLVEKQMQKLKIELERREKRDKNLGTDKKLGDGDFQNHIEDLEEEVFYWKSASADLENEVEALKSESNELKGNVRDNGEDMDEDCSIGSLQSFNSKMSQDDVCFASNSNSMRNISGVAPFQDEEPATPSKRAMRSVTSLWSKMTSGAEPPKSNQAFPYATGSLDDE